MASSTNLGPQVQAESMEIECSRPSVDVDLEFVDLNVDPFVRQVVCDRSSQNMGIDAGDGHAASRPHCRWRPTGRARGFYPRVNGFESCRRHSEVALLSASSTIHRVIHNTRRNLWPKPRSICLEPL